MLGSVLPLGRSALVPAFEGDVHSAREGSMGSCGGLKVNVGQLNHLGWGQGRLSGRGSIQSGY